MAPDWRFRMPGKDGLDHRDGTEEVGFEQRPDFGVVALLDGGAVTVAGVVDQHVDAAETFLRLRARQRRPVQGW